MSFALNAMIGNVLLVMIHVGLPFRSFNEILTDICMKFTHSDGINLLHVHWIRDGGNLTRRDISSSYWVENDLS